MARSTLVLVVLVVYCFMHMRRKVYNIGGAKGLEYSGARGQIPSMHMGSY